jgi:hypothetical protein
MNVLFVLEKIGDDFDALPADKGPFVAESILCLDRCQSLEKDDKRYTITMMKILSLART